MTLSFKERFRLSRFIKGEKKGQQSIRLNQRRIFILPTKRGLGFVILMMLLLLIAFVYNNNLAYLLGFLLAGIFFVTILHSYKSLAGLVVSQGHSQPVFAGQAAGFDIVVDNPLAIPRLKLHLSLENVCTFALQANEKKRLTLYSSTRQRGWHQIDTVTVSSLYPLGLFRAWAPLRFQSKVLVYPRPANSELPFPEAEGIQAQSVQNRVAAKGNDDFYGLKAYQAGDSIKHIHWKAFAKGQGVFSKQYAGDQLAELWLNYDQATGHNVEQRLSQLCRWVVDAEKAGLVYGFMVPGLKLEPSHGEAHYAKCLQALALF